MQPIRLQRIVLAAEHDADIGGVFLRRIEIRVTRDRDRQMHFDIRHRHQRALTKLGIVANLEHMMTRSESQMLKRELQGVRPGAAKARPDNL